MELYELDNFLKITNWTKNLYCKEDNQLKWGLGYDENSKDGLFITRNTDTIFIDNDKTKIN